MAVPARALWILCQLAGCSAMTQRVRATLSESSAAAAEHGSYLSALSSLLRGCSGLECMRRYVEEADPVYGWTRVGEVHGVEYSNWVGYTVHLLNMTSQRWLTPKESSASIWWHPLAIVVPQNLEATNWTTLVAGGAAATMDKFLPGKEAQWASNPDVTAAIQLATRTKAVSAALLMVPNQAMVLPDFGGAERTEDGIKAYTYVEYLNDPGHNPEWPIEMPMAKAVVRGMDTVTAFVSTLGLPGGAAANYAVTGCSKRGMISYHVAAVDSRVKAIMPMVIVPNMRKFTDLVARTMHGTPMFMHDYKESGISGRYWEPKSDQLLGIIDAAFFMDRFAGLPKLAMFAANDDIWGPDGDQVFWKDLPEPKSFLTVPNLPHRGSMSLADWLPSAAAFVRGLATGVAEPRISWSLDGASGTITARQLSNHAPSVTQWTAVSCRGCGRRDFRLFTADTGPNCTRCGIEHPEIVAWFTQNFHYTLPGWCAMGLANHYQPTPLKETAPGSREWRATVEAPSDGRWAATFLAFEYPGEEMRSTQVLVYPDVYPFEGCTGAQCLKGALV